VVSLLLILGGNNVHGVLFWLFGSFANIRLDEAMIIIVPTIFLSAGVLVYARELNVILLGHEQAWQLGVNSRSFKRLMMVITALLTGIAVAFTGIIAFLGLIVPHIARILVGGDHRLLLPASMMLGTNILLVADLAARSFTVGELPVGILISLIGAPFFGYLLIRRGRQYVG
jgi:iron complex transport system permease protein